jgi:hypothetical protein
LGHTSRALRLGGQMSRTPLDSNLGALEARVGQVGSEKVEGPRRSAAGGS